MEQKAVAAASGRAAARDDPRNARSSGEAAGAGVAGEVKQRVLRRRDPAGGFAADTSARAAGFLPGLEALDDLPLELMGDDEEAESQLFSLLQRLRFSGTEAGASFGFDLCELALAVGAAQPGDAEADAAGKEAQADRGDTADKAATEASPEPKRNRAAARQRARFVKSLLAASLAEPEARGADEGPP